jgi:hypothetical protein
MEAGMTPAAFSTRSGRLPVVDGPLSKDCAMKQYLLSVLQPTEAVPPQPDVLQKIMRNVHALRDEMKSAGAWVFSGGLHEPSTATVLRPRNGEVLTIDGPFTESKEYIGGFSIIKASDLDAALAWGRKLAAATTLPIEVRPFIAAEERATEHG